MNSKPDKFIPSLYGGLLIATIWSVPGLNFLNCLCCAGVLIGGFLAVLLYQRELTEGMEPLTKDDCVQIGIYTGVVSSVAAALIQYITTVMFGNIAIDIMMRIVERMHLDLPPEFYPMVEEARNAEPNLFGSILGIFIYLLPGTLFSYLGALIGWRVFQPKEPV
ncbi:MAG: hypothetical protein ACOYNS_07365 [Bacteroidota bacterium]